MEPVYGFDLVSEQVPIAFSCVGKLYNSMKNTIFFFREAPEIFCGPQNLMFPPNGAVLDNDRRVIFG